jgi:hypothetical protein
VTEQPQVVVGNVLRLAGTIEEAEDLIADKRTSATEGITLLPYQVMWLIDGTIG